jgi:hypothetical protein
MAFSLAWSLVARPDYLDPGYLPCRDVQRVPEGLAEDSCLLVHLDGFL